MPFIHVERSYFLKKCEVKVEENFTRKNDGAVSSFDD
jgi:hypothetical protein